MSLNSLDRKVQGRIMKALRLIWSQTFRAKALSLAAAYYYPVNKDGSLSKRRLIKGYICNHCSQLHKKSEVQVDHKITVHTGKTLTERLDLLFCDLDNLQVLCADCHRTKTNKERR